jgi:periplasmic divalent cation tolerance protein
MDEYSTRDGIVHKDEGKSEKDAKSRPKGPRGSFSLCATQRRQRLPAAGRSLRYPYSSTEFATLKSRRGLMMKADARYRIVLVTCASIAEARKIAQHAVKQKLAACATIVPQVESIYRWKGKVERARETLLMIKTTAARLHHLEKEVQRLHSYDVPEFVAVPIVAGSQQYLGWLRNSVS